MSKQKSEKQSLSWTGTASVGAGTATAANLAKTFTPGTPMYEPGVDKAQYSTWMNVPAELQTLIDQKMKKIGPDCLNKNVQIVLDLYQDMIIRHICLCKSRTETWAVSSEETRNWKKIRILAQTSTC